MSLTAIHTSPQSTATIVKTAPPITSTTSHRLIVKAVNAHTQPTMTSLFPHPDHAEDQPNARTILYLHVLRASTMTFAFLSVPLTGLTLLTARLRNQPLSSRLALSRLLLNSGRGLVIGALAGPAMTWARMRGREDVEWQDRSWRLLENQGEVRTDWETVGAAGVGALAGAAAARRGNVALGVGRAALGGAGLGLGSGVLFMVGTFAVGREPA